MKKALFALALLATMSGHVWAALSYWDINGANNSSAGGATPSGTWNATNTFWNNDANDVSGAAVSAWTAGNTAVFSTNADATGAYTVTVTGTQSVGGITLEDGNVTTAGTGTMDFGAAGGTITVNSGHTFTEGSTNVITGTDGGIVKAGTGTLVLQGANTFVNAGTGTQPDLTINAGVVEFSADNQLGAVSSTSNAIGGVLTINGGTLRYNNSASATLNVNRNIDIGASGATIEVTQSNNLGLSLAGSANSALTLRGTSTITKTGPGRFTLNTTQTGFTGKWIILDGTLRIAGDAAPNGRLGPVPATPTADYITLNGGILASGTTGAITLQTNRGITLGANGGALSQPGAGPFTYAGVIAGTAGGALTYRSSDTVASFNGGVFAISGANTYNGPTIVSIVSSGASLASSNTTLSIASMPNGGTPSPLGASSNASTNLRLDGGTLQYTGAGDTSDRGFMLTTNGGKLEANGTGALKITGNMAVGTLTGAAVASGAQTLALLGTSTQSNELSGTISNGGGTNVTSVASTGSGLWILSNSNTYSGTTTITSGTLGAGNNSAFGTSTISLNGGTLATSGGARNLANPTTLNVTSAVTATNNLEFSGSFTSIPGANRNLTNNANTGTVTLSGPVYLSDSSGTGGNLFLAGIGSNNPTFIVSGNISNFNGVGGTAGNITAGNSTNSAATGATVLLTGNNTHTGTTGFFSGSLLKIGSANALGGSTLTALSGGSFDNATGGALTVTNALNMSGGSPTFVGTNNLTMGNANIAGGNRTLTVTANTISFSGLTQDVAGRNFTKAGAGTMVMRGAATNSGTTAITGGILQLGDGGATGSTLPGSAISISSGANLTFNRNNTATQGVDFATAAISGAGSVTQAGTSSSIVVLNAANTYTGGTNVNGGTLLANNTTGSGTGTGAVAVNSGGTFGGTGSVTGAVNVNAGGTLSPGASIESLGTGTLTFSATALSMSTLKYEISPTNGDLVNAVGTKASGGFLNIADPTTTAGTKLDIIDNAYIPTGNKYTVAIYDGNIVNGVVTGWNGKKFNNDINGYVYGGGASPRQFLIKYTDAAPGTNFSGEATAAIGANPNTRFVTLVAVPELGSFLTMGLVGCCVLGAVRFGKRYGFKALSL